MTKTVQITIRTLCYIGVLLVAIMFAVGYGTHQYLANRGAKLDLASLKSVESILKQKFDGSISDEKLLDGAKQGLVSSAGDPYTVYLTAADAKLLSNDLNGTLSGIGAEIGLRNNHLTVISPVPGTPAAKAGLLSGDVIVKINGEDPSGLSLDEAVAKIRGPKGTKVTLSISRASAAAYDIVITRDDISVPSVNWSMKPGNVGYIQIVRFGADTGDKVDQAATELTSHGASKFVLDLRDDPGGYLDQAVKVASEFMDHNKLVVEERVGSKTKDKQYVTDGGKLVGKPVVVLINGGSASASEILAGALHDQIKTQLIGQKSFGKGSVQEIVDLSGGAELKVTVAHWYTPAGINIGKQGIKPDVEVTLSPDDINAGRDPQLDKALSIVSAQ